MNGLGRQAGMTLVELMVATTLSLVLLAGVLLVFSANKATYQLQNGMGTLQENGRYAARQIAADLQLAGYGGCLSPHLDPKPRIINVVSGSPSFLDSIAAGEFFAGFDHTGSTTYGGISTVLNTDAIEIRGPLRSTLSFVTGAVPQTGNITVQGTGTGFAANEYLLIADCASATIFRATSVSTSGGNTVITHTTGNTGNALAQPYGTDSTVMEFATHTYFVGQTGRSNRDGDAINALYRFDGNNSVELVDGVDNMQIEYALDTDADNVIDAFRTAGGITDWGEVVAVRISLLMNSVEGASAVEAPYTFFPQGSTAVSPTSGDYRLRQEFSALISIRNSVF